MDQRIALMLQTLGLNTQLLLNCLEGVDEETHGRRLCRRTNNMSFIGTHLVDARFYLARQLGMEAPSPFPDLETVTSVEQLESCPTLMKVRDSWQEGTRLLETGFQRLTAADLDREFPDQLPVPDSTLAGAITFLLSHEAYHIGQLALLRKHFGLEAMAYPG